MCRSTCRMPDGGCALAVDVFRRKSAEQHTHPCSAATPARSSPAMAPSPPHGAQGAGAAGGGNARETSDPFADIATMWHRFPPMASCPPNSNPNTTKGASSSSPNISQNSRLLARPRRLRRVPRALCHTGAIIRCCCVARTAPDQLFYCRLGQQRHLLRPSRRAIPGPRELIASDKGALILGALLGAISFYSSAPRTPHPSS